MPALREELEVLVPEDHGPGRPWKAGRPAPAPPAAVAARPIRIGYAGCSTAQQELASHLAALEPVCNRIFSEKISTRIKTRPELEKALKLAYDIKEAAPDQEVILTVHELKRLACNAAELMPLSGQLQAADVQLELLTGPFTGIYDPNGMGAMFFAVLTVAAQLDRNYIREKTLEGRQAAAAKGNPRRTAQGHRRRLSAARPRAAGQRCPRPRDRGQAHHQDRQKRGQAPLDRLAVPGARRGRRHLRVRRGTGHRPPPSGPRPHHRRPGSDTDPAQMERLTAQVLDGDTVLDDLTRQAGGGPDDLVAQLLAQARNGDR
ncbi:recombinase family protein [Streptomyces rubrogriseus]|uniref:recombinase family protein n=1 Tax=Streptomyces rubrogriseus TaxID=194673 RepID=UPI0037D8A513